MLGASACPSTPHTAPAWWPAALQASFGVLLTQALLWAWEERLRWRELQRWRERRRQPRAEQCEARPGPLSWCTLLVWWLGSSWGVWLLLEAALL